MPPGSRRSRLTGHVPRLVAVAMAAVLGLASVGAAPALAASGSHTVAASTYRLDPAGGRLEVTVRVSVTNRDAGAALDEAGIWVESDARGVRALSGGRSLRVTLGPKNEWYRSAYAAFPALRAGRTRTIEFRYTVHGAAPRSDNYLRTLRAYASFCVLANGDEARVTVTAPTSFDLETTGERLSSSAADGIRTFRSGTISDPEAWYACLAGPSSHGYRQARLPVPGVGHVALSSWPEDPDWADAVGRRLTAGIPALQALVGVPMPVSGDLLVREGSTGIEYAGFYDRHRHIATVDEHYAQPDLVEHELAHAWFNDATFASTWMSEGLAEWAAREITGMQPCARPPAADAGLDLGTWRYLDPRSTVPEREVVAAQYEAACDIMTQVAEAAGTDRLRVALAALVERRDPYAGGVAGTRVRVTATWQDWLDAVDELALLPAGANEGTASSLLLAYGITDDRGLLTARATARRTFHELAVDVDWAIPAAVRAPLAGWRFDDAVVAMKALRAAWRATGEADHVLPELDARHGPVAAAAEAATTLADLAAAADLAARQLEGAEAVVAARRTLARPLDLFAQVGLGDGPVPGLDGAVEAARAGDVERVRQIAADAELAVAALHEAGQRTVLAVALGVPAVVVLVVVLGVMVRRRARRRAFAPVPVAVPVAGPPIPADVPPIPGVKPAIPSAMASAGALPAPPPASTMAAPPPPPPASSAVVVTEPPDHHPPPPLPPR